MTPSDRADAISSSKRPAAIPTQRSDRALRLLVLGTGDDAVAFRERATQAGAELAQRFSVRVTHVVAEDGVGEQDARVVRARTAGIPVLGLADGDRLLADDEAQAGAQAPGGDPRAETRGEAGVRDAAEEVGAGSVEAGGGDAGGAGGAMDDGRVEDGLGAATEVGAEKVEVEAELREVEVEGDPHRRVVSLVRPRAELAPEPTEVRPSDVFTDSALEAVLHFPPLHTEEGEGDVAVGEACACSGEGVEGQAGVPAGADAHEAAVESGAGAGADAEAVAGSGEAGVGASAVPREARSGRRLTSGTAASVAWALLPLVSIGLLTPASIGYAAYRLRSRVLIIATICYTVFVTAAFAVSAASPVHTGTHAAAGELLLACLGVSWLGGTAHGLLIRRRVFG